MGMKLLAAILFTGGVAILSAIGQQPTSAIVKQGLAQAEIDRIVRKFTENEGEFRAALTNYVFNRYATIQTVGLGGQITGTYRRDSFMTFKSDGSRFEKILFAPLSSLNEITITPEDLEDLGGINPFALEPSSIQHYNFSFVGTETIDGLDLYVFDVVPKIIPDPKKTKLRLFSGRIWVEKDDLMIVKSRGKAVPETKDNKYPIVETTRLPVDNKYYFPVDVRADDELVFDNGHVARIKMRVRFTDYKVGRTEVRILDDDEPVKPTPTPTPKKP